VALLASPAGQPARARPLSVRTNPRSTTNPIRPHSTGLTASRRLGFGWLRMAGSGLGWHCEHNNAAQRWTIAGGSTKVRTMMSSTSWAPGACPTCRPSWARCGPCSCAPHTPSCWTAAGCRRWTPRPGSCCCAIWPSSDATNRWSSHAASTLAMAACCAWCTTA
jgi:hypothetical protein